MKKQLLLIIAIALIQCINYAQTNVSTMDISVTPIIEIDSVTGLQIDTTIVKLNVSFKVKNVNEAEHAYILFGSVHDLGDVKTVVADFTNVGGSYQLSYNSISYPISQYTAQAEITLTTDEENDYDFITMYVIDINGIESNRIYFTK